MHWSRILRWTLPAAVAASLAVAGTTRTAWGDPPSGDWRVEFADEFSGTTLDTVKWSYNYPWGNTHNHDAYVDEDHVILGDGALTLLAERQAQGGKPFTSGAISTGYTKYTVNGGYIEANILLPDTPGSWPAFWGLYTGWPPEADIMEYPLRTTLTGPGYDESDYHTAFHYTNSSGDPAAGAGKIVNPLGTIPTPEPGDDEGIDLGGAYHTFGMEWRAGDWVGYYFDGNLVSQFGDDAAIAQMQYMYLILNYGVGGWPDTPSLADWPADHTDQTKVDWVHVWKPAPASATSTWTYVGSSVGSWSTSSNWSGPVPNYERQVVNLPTLAGRPTMELRWGGSRTVNDVVLDGTTVYTLGEAGGGVESIMFADSVDRWGSITVEGDGGHVFNARLDLWSSLSAVNNGTNPVTFNGDIVGQARLTANRGVGGELRLSGTGQFIINGNGYYQRATTITGGVTVDLNGGLYADGNCADDAVIRVDGGSTLRLGTYWDTALGDLPSEAGRVVIDNGRIVCMQTSNAIRGFTIGPGGATIEADSGASLRMVEISGDPGTQVVSDDGADLTLGGAGNGRFRKSLGGSGGLVKTGSGSWSLGVTNSYTGQTIVDEGLLTVDATTGTGDTIVHTGGELNGAGDVLGDLISDGIVSPGASAGTLNVAGSYTQNGSGVLQIELQAATAGSFDVLVVGGTATLDGDLQLSLLGGFAPTVGDSFEILTASGIAGQLHLTGDAAGFSLSSDGTALVLQYGPLPGDYDGDGTVDVADYEVWRAAFGTTDPAADGNGDRVVDGADYTLWRDNVGAGSPASAAGSLAPPPAVPEPGTLLPLCAALACLAVVARRRRLAVPATRS